MPKAPVIVADESARPNAGVSPNPPAAAVKTDTLPAPSQKTALIKGQNQRPVDAEEQPDEKGPAPKRGSAAALILLIAFLIFFLFALPVLAVMSDPISGLIYSFALWEAWKLNKGATWFSTGRSGQRGRSERPTRPEVDGDDG